MPRTCQLAITLPEAWAILHTQASVALNRLGWLCSRTTTFTVRIEPAKVLISGKYRTRTATTQHRNPPPKFGQPRKHTTTGRSCLIGTHSSSLPSPGSFGTYTSLVYSPHHFNILKRLRKGGGRYFLMINRNLTFQQNSIAPNGIQVPTEQCNELSQLDGPARASECIHY